METPGTPNPNSPTVEPPTKTARYLPAIARVLMGLMFFVFGLNGFLRFIPEPKKQMSEAAMGLMSGMMKSGYMLPMVAGTQVLVGALLLFNRFVPLALILIAPVIVNIIAFHIFLDPATIVPGVVVLVLELYLAWAYRKNFAALLAAQAKPD